MERRNSFTKKGQGPRQLQHSLSVTRTGLCVSSPQQSAGRQRLEAKSVMARNPKANDLGSRSSLKGSRDGEGDGKNKGRGSAEDKARKDSEGEDETAGGEGATPAQQDTEGQGMKAESARKEMAVTGRGQLPGSDSMKQPTTRVPKISRLCNSPWGRIQLQTSLRNQGESQGLRQTWQNLSVTKTGLVCSLPQQSTCRRASNDGELRGYIVVRDDINNTIKYHYYNPILQYQTTIQVKC